MLRIRFNGLVYFVPTAPHDRTEEVVRKALETYSKHLGIPPGTGALPSSSELFLRMDDGTYVPSGIEMALLDVSNKEIIYTLSRAQAQTQDEWVCLNVGGTVMHTARSTLLKDSKSMLARMFGPEWADSHRTDHSGAFLLDLDAKYFAPVLNFLRTGRLTLDVGISREGVAECARFLQVEGVLEQLSEVSKPVRPNYHIMMLACRLASWIGLSGAVPKSVPQKFKFSNTRKFGNQYELYSHSNELVALILNDLARMGWYVISCSSGGAGGDISVYQSYLLASTNEDIVMEDLITLPLSIPATPGQLPGSGPNGPILPFASNNNLQHTPL